MLNKSGKRNGQSLVEILIGIAITALIVTVAVGSINLAIRSNVANTGAEQGTPLGQELSDKLKSLSEGNWFSLYNLTRNTNYFIVNDNGLKVTPGVEGLVGDDIKSGLITQWKLDEATNSPSYTAYDSSSINNKATQSIAANIPTPITVTANCKVGNCLDFDGINDYLTVPYQSSLALTNAFSLSFWIYLDSDPNTDGTSPVNEYRRILGHVSGTGPVLVLLEEGRAVSFSMYVGGQRYWRIGGSTSSSAFPINQWTHFVLNYDSSNGMANIYKNGVVDKTGIPTLSVSPFTAINSAGCPCALDSNTSNWTLSRDPGSPPPVSNGSIPGKLDDVRIYSRALLPAEVTQLYRSSIYSRSFVVQTICRNTSSGVITGLSDSNGTASTCATSGGTVDPSTLQVTSTVNLPQGTPLQFVEYLSRLNNAVNDVTDWKDPSSYSAISPANSINTNTPGEIKLFQ